MEYVGWIVGWPLRLLNGIQNAKGTPNFVLSLIIFLLFWKLMISVWDCFAQKRAARTEVCSRMLNQCRDTLYSKNPKAYESCGLEIYKITKTGALTSFWNFIVPLIFIYLLLFVLYHPLTYFFGITASELSAVFGSTDQIEIIRSVLSNQYSETITQSDLFVIVSNCIYGIKGISVVDIASVHNISIILPIVVLLLQSKRIVMNIIALFSKKLTTPLKKRGMALGISIFILALSLTTAFVLPIFIGLELIVWLIGSDIFAFIFKRTIGKGYRAALNEMEDKCKKTIQDFENAAGAQSVTD